MTRRAKLKLAGDVYMWQPWDMPEATKSGGDPSGYTLAPGLAQRLFARIDAWREKNNLTDRKAGKRFGIDHQYLSDWRHGRRPMKRAEVQAMARVAKVRESELLAIVFFVGDAFEEERGPKDPTENQE